MSRIKWLAPCILFLTLAGCEAISLFPTPTPPPPTPKPPTPIRLTPIPPLLLSTPTPTPILTPTSPPSVEPKLANIIVTLPTAGQRVRSPLRISGTARVYEGQLEVVIKGAAGNTIAKTTALASEGAPKGGSFSVDLLFEAAKEQEGTIEAFSRSPKDGRVEDLVVVKVILLPK